ncbi:MAG: SRPBCC family protein [Betaproteobacteria bacterium]|nr:SRPBCC family protein [Betaproteobacteria bacterium]
MNVLKLVGIGEDPNDYGYGINFLESDMKILTRALALLAMFVAFVVGASFLLPGEFNSTRSTLIAATPEKIWPLLADPKAWKSWSASIRKDPAMRIQYLGSPNGEGAVWAWRSRSQGNGRVSFLRAKAPSHLTYQLETSSTSRLSYGEFILEPANGRTRVVWSLSGQTGWSPLARWLGVFVDKKVGPDFETGLANLKQLVETKS